MTKEELKQYSDLNLEIAKLEKRIDRLKNQSEIISDVVQNGYKHHAVIRGYDCNRAYKLDFLKEKLQDRLEMCKNLEVEIEDFIKGIPKSELRQIFELRFKDGLQLFEVAHEMNDLYKTSKYTADSIRMKIERYLKKF